ncbi:MAG: hypothetical protein COT14_02405 [Candidatus Diapherotrites archaeon CG08_land_8_20_14_0_20_30_16]|nr:MAG: hypothetical protein COT14_02405 [Candidatus Diapherotrites archaeon CG08_land_8_20_14_0_20_30_16]
MQICKLFGIFFGLFLLLGIVTSLDIIQPGSYDSKVLALYPGLNTTVGFLKVESGTQVFVDSLDCKDVSCGTIKTSGPYYVFDVVAGNSKSGKITINYHLKGSVEELKNTIILSNSNDSLSVLIFLPTEAKFFEKTNAKIMIVNNSDLKLSGKITTNFPEDVFLPIDFVLEPKTKAEYETYFFPKNPGYYDLVFYVSVDGTDDSRKVAQQTVFIKRELKDFFALPTKSYFPTNPLLGLYSSIVYFISLLA